MRDVIYESPFYGVRFTKVSETLLSYSLLGSFHNCDSVDQVVIAVLSGKGQ